jgi:hypothetical protein
MLPFLGHSLKRRRVSESDEDDPDFVGDDDVIVVGQRTTKVSVVSSSSSSPAPASPVKRDRSPFPVPPSPVPKRKTQKGKARMTKLESYQRLLDMPDHIVKLKYDSFLKSCRKVFYGKGANKHECWEHTLKTTSQGYGQCHINGRDSDLAKYNGCYLVHAMSARHHGLLHTNFNDFVDPDISHLCHNKLCFNPRHLLCYEEGRTNKRRNICPARVRGVEVCSYLHDGPPCLHAHARFEAHGVRRYAGYAGGPTGAVMWRRDGDSDDDE